MTTIDQTIMTALQYLPRTAEEILAVCVSKQHDITLADLVTDELTVLQELEQVTVADGVWSLTAWGREKLRLPKRPKLAASPYRPPAGVYTGAELQATCLRKGAYDFLLCDSVVNGKLVPYRTAHLHEGAMK